MMPCSEKRARKLLQAGRARVHRLYPFTIRLVDVSHHACEVQPLRLSLDPGSRTTGLALCRVDDREVRPTMHIVFLMELVHRGMRIRSKLLARSKMRRSRRSRSTRYRAPRFENRVRPEGWLVPSLRHRIETMMSWVRRLRRLAPITLLAEELVRFDLEAMQAAEEGRGIEGLQYQRGTHFGYELGEYLLAKWGRRCAYCDSTGLLLEKEHILAKSRGGTDRISNLALACRPCNEAKGGSDVREFLAHDPVRLRRILATAKKPLKDAAAVNATRWALFHGLRATHLPVEAASGGRTKFNRVRLGIPKTHALDAACVGTVRDVLGHRQPVLQASCTGRGSRSRTRLDAFGFPRGYLMRQKLVHGFRTGDMVTATVVAGRNAGVHVGRVAVRQTGSFNLQTHSRVVQGINHKYCRLLMRGDGYGYSWKSWDSQDFDCLARPPLAAM